MKYEELVNECKRLRSASVTAEVEFLLFLRLAEIECGELLKERGIVSFEKFLTGNDLCRPERYRDFVVALEALGEPTMREMGIEAAVVSAKRLTSKTAREEMSEAAKAFREKQGTPMSRQVAEYHAARIEPKKATPRVIGTMAELHQLRAQRDQWDRDRLSWERERTELVNENAALRKRLGMNERPNKTKARTRKVA